MSWPDETQWAGVCILVTVALDWLWGKWRTWWEWRRK